eukprot:gene29391-38480_t
MNYIRGSNADIKLKPLCPNPITLMRASDDLTSWQSFNLAGDQRGFTIVGREDRLQGNANLTLSSALVGESAVMKTLMKVLPGKHVLHISAYPLNGPQFNF